MTTFKEIDINEYKKLLNNMQHIYAKTFKNIELLHNFEENVNNKKIDSIIKNQESLKKEDKYIKKLSDKISSKISNSNQNIVKNNNKYVFLNPYQYYNENPELILNHFKDLYIKSNISYKDIYQPNAKTKTISLDSVITSIKKDGHIPNNLKGLIFAHDNIANKTKIKYSKDIYDQYVLDPIAQYYIDKDDKKDDNLSLDDESFKRELEDHSKDMIPKTSDKTKKDKSLKHKLKSDVSKTIIKSLTGQGLNFNRIKIDENLLKKNILNVRYINSNRRVNNKFLKEDYKISNNMKNAGLNKLTKNEYDIYNILQKYRKTDNNLQLLMSSYLAGNKSKDLYNKINELLYKNYKNNVISKKQYQNIINKL